MSHTVNKLKVKIMHSAKWTIVGRLTKDVEIRNGQNSEFAIIKVATEKTYRGENGQQNKKTFFHSIICFKAHLMNYLSGFKKGNLVHLEGELVPTEKTDQNNNRIYENNLELLDAKNFGGGNSQNNNDSNRNQNQGYANNGNSNQNQGYANNRNSNQNQGYANNRNSNQNQGYANNGNGNQNQGYANNGNGNQNQGYSDQNLGYSDQNLGYGYTNNNNDNVDFDKMAVHQDSSMYPDNL